MLCVTPVAPSFKRAGKRTSEDGPQGCLPSLQRCHFGVRWRWGKRRKRLGLGDALPNENCGRAAEKQMIYKRMALPLETDVFSRACKLVGYAPTDEIIDLGFAATRSRAVWASCVFSTP